jgi:biotin carboxyl carrier protein
VKRVRLVPDGTGSPVDVELDGDSALLPGGERVTIAWLNRGTQRGRVRLGDREAAAAWVLEGDRLELWLDGEHHLFLREAPTGRGRRRHRILLRGGEIRSPMPGVVRELLAGPGESVDAGRPLVLLESMKMHLTLAAPASGKVREMRCAPGDRVERDQVLVLLDPAGGDGGEA